MPIFFLPPQRHLLPEKLCKMLQKYHPLWMSVHVNHRAGASPPKCVTHLAAWPTTVFLLEIRACLLAGVNDDVETMRTLVHKH